MQSGVRPEPDRHFKPSAVSLGEASHVSPGFEPRVMSPGGRMPVERCVGEAKACTEPRHDGRKSGHGGPGLRFGLLAFRLLA